MIIIAANIFTSLSTCSRYPLKPMSGGGSGVEFVGVATSTNTAYELIKGAKEKESEYDVVNQSVPPVAPPPLPQDREGGYANLPGLSKQSPASPSPAVAPSQNEDGSQVVLSGPSDDDHPPAMAPSEGGKGGTEEKEAVY